MSYKYQVGVAVSGGVDSLYTLISLKELGLNVVAIHGIFAQFLELSSLEESKLAKEAAQINIQRLEELCKELDIPLHVVDCSSNFYEFVIKPFALTYAQGLTPNPCALCNANVKLPILQKMSEASVLATGHYVRAISANLSILTKNKFYDFYNKNLTQTEIWQGADKFKDQSYFLALTPLEVLDRCIFPLGAAAKPDIIKFVKDRGFKVPQPKESQEICFIPNDSYRTFLPDVAKKVGASLNKEGDILLTSGKCIGTHKGLWQYTQGQRKGLNIAWKEPLYVLEKNIQNNTLILGSKLEVYTLGFVCNSLNFIIPFEQWGKDIFVKTRYKELPKPIASIEDSKNSLKVMVEREDVAAPGQIAAFYDIVPNLFEKDGRPVMRLLGGGVIESNIWK